MSFNNYETKRNSMTLHNINKDTQYKVITTNCILLVCLLSSHRLEANKAYFKKVNIFSITILNIYDLTKVRFRNVRILMETDRTGDWQILKKKIILFTT